jgi:integrase
LTRRPQGPSWRTTHIEENAAVTAPLHAHTSRHVHACAWAPARLGRVTLGEYAEPWLAARVHLKPKTVAGSESLLKTRVLPRWGAVPLDRITFDGVSAWATGMMAEGLSASRTQQAYHLLTSMLDDAVKGSRIPRNPARGVDLPRITSKPGRYLTRGQLADLAEACGDYQTLVLVLGYCGIRWGEAAGLTVQQDHRTLHRLEGLRGIRVGASFEGERR